MKIISEDEAGKNALRGDMLMVQVYGDGVNITVAINREDVAEVINDFTDHFPQRDPVDMAKVALRAAMKRRQISSPRPCCWLTARLTESTVRWG